MICGADTWVDIESYGRAKYEWLKTILELPNGIPSMTQLQEYFLASIRNNFRKVF
ncbi:MAG: transposase family protein [Microcoleus sp. PH2017_27_LUM_O_A]|nr:transposase family protein [Microcoleus sp. PH2017_11_PCY_U_A]MCC3482693.1 transposase family protein [Microcoleus sp. PH2017_12_PCY_D_A]MCC3563666.1 transposase family protein [Microcoleus sp. PH2017_27_LUM_O_A]